MSGQHFRIPYLLQVQADIISRTKDRGRYLDNDDDDTLGSLLKQLWTGKWRDLLSEILYWYTIDQPSGGESARAIFTAILADGRLPELYDFDADEVLSFRVNEAITRFPHPDSADVLASLLMLILQWKFPDHGVRNRLSSLMTIVAHVVQVGNVDESHVIVKLLYLLAGSSRHINEDAGVLWGALCCIHSIFAARMSRMYGVCAGQDLDDSDAVMSTMSINGDAILCAFKECRAAIKGASLEIRAFADKIR